MKEILNRLTGPMTFRTASAAFFLFIYAPVFFEGSSWLDAFKAALTFIGIWALGYFSATLQKGQP
jgi:hypothetical protein